MLALEDWVPLWIQGAVAAGTIGLAAGTVYLGVKARDEASATELLARETQADRELVWRPALTVVRLELFLRGGHLTKSMEIGNAGGGPGIRCRVVWLGHNKRWFVSSPVDVSPNTGAEFPYWEQSGSFPVSWFSGPAVRGAVFCADLLERRWRFEFTRQEDDSIHYLAPDMARRDDLPGWATIPEIWG